MSGISDINWLFQKYYGDNPDLRRIVTVHSEQVARKALEICKAKQLPLNPKEVYCAAMLHDIGVVKCHAPDINAFGELPYICHGPEGKKILQQHKLFQFASICSTHTGAGITKQEIINNNLPVPLENMLPNSLLEKLICYADKFFSKSKNLKKEKTLDEILKGMQKFGQTSVERFFKLHSIFGIE